MRPNTAGKHEWERRAAPLDDLAMEQHIRALAVSLNPDGNAALRFPSDRALHAPLAAVHSLTGGSMPLPSALEWLADNGRMAEALMRAMCRETGGKLPAAGGTPRIQQIMREMVRHGDGLVSAERMERSLTAFDEVRALTMRELWAAPSALAAALSHEYLHAAARAAEAQRDRTAAEKWAEAGAETDASLAHRSAAFFERALSCLQEKEMAAKYQALTKWMEEHDRPVAQVISQEHENQAFGRLVLGNILTSLRMLEGLDWSECFEKVSRTEKALLADPAGTYPQMDRDSRARVRGRVTALAAALMMGEATVAKCALEAAGECDDIRREISWWLYTDAGAEALMERVGMKARLPRMTPDPRGRKYMLSVGLIGTALFLGAFMAWKGAAVAGIPVWWGAAAAIVNAVSVRMTKPNVLLKLGMEAVPPECGTLVVMPALLSSPARARELAGQIETLGCLEKDEQISFLLLGDLIDHDESVREEDSEVVRAAEEAIFAANRRAGREKYYFLYRERVFQESEQRYMGRERKRGALNALNRLLLTGENAFAGEQARELYGRFAYVLTVDAGTRMLPGTIRKMIGAMAHPLNRRHRGPDGKMAGYAILAPRMELPADAIHSRFVRLMAGGGGVDSYPTAVSDVYQDVCGQGVFGGKGIYEVAAFEEGVAGKLPDNAILSHDMIEGILAGAGFLSDIALYDGFPKTMRSFLMRQHRWIRGDWQLLRLLADRRLRLHGLDVYRILDNLRRSLEPAAGLLLLYMGFYARSVWLVGAALLPAWLPLILYPRWTKERWAGACMRVMLLPHEAFNSLSAALTALWRMGVSHRRLLQWVTADDAERRGGRLSPAPGWAASVLLLPAMAAPAPWLLTDALLAAVWWTSAALIQEAERPEEEEELYPEEKEKLRALAEKTFRFFAEHTPLTGLTPDNVQTDPPVGAAMRTSPTNIGMYLMACVSAREIGLIPGEEMARRASETLHSLETMEKWRGQIYNWYHPVTLEPLRPRYVSSVDSGNLAACMLLCARSLEAEGHKELAGRMEKLARKMDFSALFDEKRQLFYIGMDVENDRMSTAHYDLLASESRILSFTAMMLGQIPASHWAHLGRTATPAGKSAALISWSGTMFEYLMPDLFLPVSPGTLLHQTQQAVLERQMAAEVDVKGGRLWGISESGYYAFDAAMNYQYRAFGLPCLSLRGDAAEKVIAPYASMLALPFRPEEAMDNLETMLSLGLADEEGLFEAVDCSEKRLPEGERMRIVKSHMAHHQGMILCSLCNALTGNILIRRFCDRPEAQALMLLLQEKAAVRVKLSRREAEEAQAMRRPIPVRGQRSGKPDGNAPDTHLLSGCGTTMLLCADGSGFAQRNGVLLNRRETDLSMPKQGMFVYAHDITHGQRFLLSGAEEKEGVRAHMQFDMGSALCSVETGSLSSAMRILVSPEDGACLQQATLTNRADEATEVEVTACFQVALAREADYEAHPAFQNLFVESESPAEGALLFRRRPRKEEEKTDVLIHAVAGAEAGDITFETDLANLTGREGPIGSPESIRPMRGTLGHVLTPCSALNVRLTLPPGGKKSLCFAAGLVSPEEANAFIERHTSLQTAARALELAGAQAREMVRYLNMTPQKWHTLQKGAALLLYPRLKGHTLPAPPDEDMTVRDLWPMGISGDCPILLAFVDRTDRLEPVRELIRAHEFYRLMGVESDLVLICGQETGYAQPVREKVNALIAGSHLGGLIGQKGGVHLPDGHAMTEKQKKALETAAALLLKSGAASVGRAIGAALGAVSPRPVREELLPSNPMAKPALRADNGWGGFSENGYTIYRTPAPAPWCNILCNPRLGCMVSERGGGLIWYMNSRNGRLTPFDNDPLREGWGDALYLNDGKKTYAPAACPGRVTHQPGASLYEGEADAFSWKLTQFVDREIPVKCQDLRLHAKEDISVRISVSMDWLMQPFRADGRWTQTGYTEGAWWARGSAGCIGFACLEGADARMEQGRLTGEVQLKKGAEAEVSLIVGAARDAEEMRSLRDEWQAAGGARARLSETLDFWRERLGRMTLHTPDELTNRMVNEFLPYQVLCGRIWGRAGFYQAGGAFGFRDQLQDMLAVLLTDPEMVRRHLILCAGHQFQSGDVQHWWHPEYEGVRTHISDDLLFLPYAAAEYVSVTQDKEILRMQIPFLKDVDIPEGQEDWYGTAEISGETGTLHEHCVRAIRRACRVGKNGLLLMGAGDWNDGMNRVGHKGIGESVWLTEFMIVVLEKYAPLCGEETKEEFMQTAGMLREAVEQNGWDGKWYRRAFMDDGTILGSASTEGGCRIDSLSQSWAALAGLSRERVKTALKEVETQLIDREHGLIRLLTPPFDGTTTDPGYIRGYPPGVRENGGQYTHAACWLVIALAETGQADRAWEAFRMLMPWTHSDTEEKADIYRVEPYVMAADIYSELPHAGRGGWTWYTGAAGWMLRAAYVHLMGYRRKGEYASLRALLPESWDEVSMAVRVGGATYTLTARRDCGSPLIDGKPMPPEGVRLTDDGREHFALFPPANMN